jgi:hypothetical protein
LLLASLGQYLIRRSLGSSRRLGKAKGTTVTVSMDDNGIDIVGAFSNTHLKWEGVRHQPAVRSEGVLLRITKANGLWLPDRALAEGTSGDVRRLVSTHCKGW